MILDGHAHAWARWPYAPPVPDATSRGAVEQLIFELDEHGVEAALLVCAALAGNDDNLAYACAARERHPGRLHVVADVDCPWHPTHHRPGAAARLRAVADRHPLAGVAHYLGPGNDGWLRSAEAAELFAAAAERGLLLSLSAPPAWHADLLGIAAAHPELPILCHHLGLARAGDPAHLEGLARLSERPNVLVKASGFYNAVDAGWDFPWPGALALLARLRDLFGAERLVWGSDHPVSRPFATYRQTLEAVRAHAAFLDERERALVLGGSLRALLEGR